MGRSIFPSAHLCMHLHADRAENVRKASFQLDAFPGPGRKGVDAGSLLHRLQGQINLEETFIHACIGGAIEEGMWMHTVNISHS